MHRIIIMLACLFMLSACGASMPHRQVALAQGGKAYCDAFTKGDASLKKRVVRTYRLEGEAWEAYCHAMRESKYGEAADIARKRKLGPWAERKASVADADRDLRNGHIFVGYMTLKRIGMPEGERKAFGAVAHQRALKASQCIVSLEIARTFSLGDESDKASLSCILRKHGVPATLAYGCIKSVPEPLVAPHRSAFMQDLAKWHGHAVRRSDFDDAVRRCEWNRGDLESLLVFLRGVSELRLAVHVLDELGIFLPEKEKLAVSISLFDQALAEGEPLVAAEIMKSKPSAFDAARKKALLKTHAEERECARALQLTHDLGADDAAIDAVLTHPKCAMSSFDAFEAGIYMSGDDVWLKYYRFALKHRMFHLARRLADRAQKARTDDVDTYGELIHAALGDGAHALLFELSPPPDEEAETYKTRIFEHALSNGREWIAATYAAQHAENPEAVVERAFLRAMERGEWILAAQIAQKYGDPKRLKVRAEIAFEYAMHAKKPKDAMFIYRLAGLQDPERMRRAAVLRFRQKKAEERKKRLEKLRKERKRRRDSGDWYPTRL